ncbi:hypothetical protein [Agrococcus sp. Ld7]|uniref:hypothetical protein n=1 Tax=Agrococcus sp. Ld7 TaxID=649148 RepID=UPI0038660CC8
MSAGTVEDVRRARRILCFGAAGSGKSTMAVQLGERLGLPVVLVDDLCWEPGWVQPPRDELDRRVLPVLDREAYVIDSVYRFHNAAALERVDAIVGLDYPRATSLARLVRRTARRIRTRPAAGAAGVLTSAHRGRGTAMGDNEKMIGRSRSQGWTRQLPSA